jgi:hypothetical protein
VSPFWRREKPLHERLAEEADLDIGQTRDDEGSSRRSRLADLAHGLADGFLSAPPDEFGRPSPLGAVGFHGVARPRRWEVVASAEVDLPGDAVHFAALPDGTLLVDEEVPDGALLPLAEAVEQSLAPPYRAEGVRQGERVWGVAANRIEVRAFPGHAEDELELVEDGQVVLGSRLEGDLFEVEVSPL